MTRRQRLFYGWQANGEYRVSREPPDAPVRPSIAFETSAEAEEFAKQKRGELMWWPVLESKRRVAI